MAGMNDGDESRHAGGGGSSGAFNLADELLSIPSSRDDTASYNIPNEVSIPELSSSNLASTLNTAIDIIARSSSLGADPILSTGEEVDVFDTLRSYLLHFHHLNSTPSLQAKLFDAISTGFNSALEDAVRDEGSASDYPTHREALEKWAFLVQWLIIVGEREHRPKAGGADVAGLTKGKGAGKKTTAQKEGWSWTDSLPQLLGLMSKALRTLQSARLWTANIDRDAFVSGCFLRPVFLLLETEPYLKSTPLAPGAHAQQQHNSQIARGNPIKAAVTKLICQAIKFHSQSPSALALIMQSLQYSEHLSDYLAEVLYVLRIEFDHERLGEDILRDISAKNFSAQDSKSPRSFGRFLVKLAELNPATLRKGIAVLKWHLDSEVSSPNT